MSSTTKAYYINYITLLLQVLSDNNRNAVAALADEVRNRLSLPTNIQSSNENANNIIVKNIIFY